VASISSEVITDALYAQDKHGEPFVQILISGGHITEWDLAKIVTEHFNLPFLMASNYQISDDAKKRSAQGSAVQAHDRAARRVRRHRLRRDAGDAVLRGDQQDPEGAPTAISTRTSG
jgi:hypothetical protein